MESSRRDLFNDMAEHRSILKNYQTTHHPRFGFTPKTSKHVFSKTDVLFLMCSTHAIDDHHITMIGRISRGFLTFGDANECIDLGYVERTVGRINFPLSKAATQLHTCELSRYYSPPQVFDLSKKLSEWGCYRFIPDGLNPDRAAAPPRTILLSFVSAVFSPVSTALNPPQVKRSQLFTESRKLSL